MKTNNTDSKNGVADRYILEDTYNDGKPKYFKQMTAIGPMSTPYKDEAMKFETEDEAKFSEAHKHWSANWKVVKS